MYKNRLRSINVAISIWSVIKVFVMGVIFYDGLLKRNREQRNSTIDGMSAVFDLMKTQTK